MSLPPTSAAGPQLSHDRLRKYSARSGCLRSMSPLLRLSLLCIVIGQEVHANLYFTAKMYEYAIDLILWPVQNRSVNIYFKIKNSCCLLVVNSDFCNKAQLGSEIDTHTHRSYFFANIARLFWEKFGERDFGGAVIYFKISNFMSKAYKKYMKMSLPFTLLLVCFTQFWFN